MLPLQLFGQEKTAYCWCVSIDLSCKSQPNSNENCHLLVLNKIVVQKCSHFWSISSLSRILYLLKQRWWLMSITFWTFLCCDVALIEKWIEKMEFASLENKSELLKSYDYKIYATFAGGSCSSMYLMSIFCQNIWKIQASLQKLNKR